MDFDIKEYRMKITEAVSYLKPILKAENPIGIILGTGLGGLVKEIDITTTVEYKDIPHFPRSTVESHEGKLLFGTLGDKQVLAMQGRFHFYEGYSMKEITFPVRVMYE
jgi:purine-nucleoside phosphorylase